jgi:hypothetical protein
MLAVQHFQGHTEKEHETSHGSMKHTRWAVEGPDGTSLELGGHKFSSNDEGAPMMCNLVCTSMGRHVHISYCRAADGDHRPSDEPEVRHIDEPMTSNPNKPKDAVTHGLFWRELRALTVPPLKSTQARSLPLGFKG